MRVYNAHVVLMLSVCFMTAAIAEKRAMASVQSLLESVIKA